MKFKKVLVGLCLVVHNLFGAETRGANIYVQNLARVPLKVAIRSGGYTPVYDYEPIELAKTNSDITFVGFMPLYELYDDRIEATNYRVEYAYKQNVYTISQSEVAQVNAPAVLVELGYVPGLLPGTWQFKQVLQPYAESLTTSSELQPLEEELQSIILLAGEIERGTTQDLSEQQSVHRATLRDMFWQKMERDQPFEQADFDSVREKEAEQAISQDATGIVLRLMGLYNAILSLNNELSGTNELLMQTKGATLHYVMQL